MASRGALAPVDIQGLLAAKQQGLLPTGDMRAHQPTLRDMLAEAASKAGRSMGLGDIIAQRMRDEAAVGMDFMPGLGAAIGGEEAGRDIGAGNYLSGGLGLAMSMVPGGKGLKGGAERIMQNAKSRGVDLILSAPHGRLVVDKIVVPKEMRGQGVGSEVMREIAELADANGVPVSLSPSTDFGGSSKAALERFYGRHGFERNTGKKRDFEISESMRRYPRSGK
jgi:GNAT superfamily N-acetyltransferase